MEPAAQPESSRTRVALGCSIIAMALVWRPNARVGDNAAHPAKIDCDARRAFEVCSPGGAAPLGAPLGAPVRAGHRGVDARRNAETVAASKRWTSQPNLVMRPRAKRPTMMYAHGQPKPSHDSLGRLAGRGCCAGAHTFTRITERCRPLGLTGTQVRWAAKFAHDVLLRQQPSGIPP